MSITFYELVGASDTLCFSPNTWRTRMALEHKKLPYATVPWHFVEKDKIAFTGQPGVPKGVSVPHPAVVRLVLTDIHANLHEMDKAYFRKSREERFGKTLEQISADREDNLAAVRRALVPLDDTLAQQDWFGGDGPAYADYLVFGAFQWARAVSPVKLAEPGSHLAAWNERVLDLHDGAGRKLAAVTG